MVSEIKLSDKRQIIIAFAAVMLCFITAVKALSSVTTVIFTHRYAVCIDPGHGGSEQGACSKDKKRHEQDDNLRLALKIKSELEKKDVRVIMTRYDDKAVSLKQRCVIANNGKADLFVSVHRNSSEDGTGIEVWIKDEPSEKEKRLAEDILNALVKVSGLKKRGVKRGYRNTSGRNYYVNANTKMPSCLVEAGFITSENDNKNFDKNIDAYAAAIAEAICENLKKS